MPLRIKVRHNGSYFIDLSTGDVELVDGDNNPIEIPTGKPGISLCRCGASRKKPFCDGTHKTLHFDEHAPPPAPPAPPVAPGEPPAPTG
ncbi:MAG TPA: CDGSH iron-sulfur domain-containing protein [Gemmatimonadaceae bacterium]|jgi:CDGSH-type Zn-finger protein|nr:CDGSH iron-sulfur domain-containing protein [Gemmatimonadaceae bacterium]